MPRPIFISFYTRAYVEEAAALVTSLQDFGLQHDVRPQPDSGSWVRNCAHKPAFIRSMLTERPRRPGPMVWIDADARVRREPVLFDSLDCDFAAHWKDPAFGYGHELLSGTLYFSGSPASLRLLDEWCAASVKTPDVWDQRTLQIIVDRKPEWLRVAELPAGYCQIFDTMADCGEPTIEHFQASRRLGTDCLGRKH